MRKWGKRIVVGLVGALALVQLVPYGRDHSNPPVLAEPPWDSPATRELAARACFDCHSNQTEWPWYSHVAPVSWLVQRDVDEGRAHLNFSEWNRRQKDAHEAAEEVRAGDMPLAIYGWLHPAARLSDAEREQLARGLSATIGGAARGERGERGERGDEDD